MAWIFFQAEDGHACNADERRRPASLECTQNVKSGATSDHQSVAESRDAFYWAYVVCLVKERAHNTAC